MEKEENRKEEIGTALRRLHFLERFHAIRVDNAKMVHVSESIIVVDVVSNNKLCQRTTV